MFEYKKPSVDMGAQIFSVYLHSRLIGGLITKRLLRSNFDCNSRFCFYSAMQAAAVMFVPERSE